MLTGEDKRLHDRIISRFDSLKKARITHDAKWREISDFIDPTLGEFEDETRDDGAKKRQNIINSKAGSCLDIAVAGMLAGTMSPSRPWFELDTEQPGYDDSLEVRAWLEATRDLLLDIFNESTLYQAAPSTLQHVLCFGNGLMEHLDDFENVAFFRDRPIGTFVWAQNERGVIDTVGFKYHMSAQQLASEFGEEVLPQNIKDALKNDNMRQDYEVLRWVEPNREFNPTKSLAKYKRFAAFYILIDGDDMNHLFLKKSGHDEFPFHPIRWDVKGTDVYATGSPGIDSLGDIKQLQATEKIKTKAQQKMVDPPLQGPATLQGKPVSGMAGGLTLFQNGGNAEKGLRPIYTVNPPVQEMRIEIDAIEKRIEEIWFTMLFFAISRMEGVQPKNMLELTQRNQERLLQLGPILLRLHREFLGGIITRTFNQAARAGILPPAPPQLQDVGLKIRYISTMALAQQSAETDSIERMFDFAGRIAGAGFEDILDTIDSDKAGEKYAKIIGFPADALRTPEAIAGIRQARAQAQQAQAMAEMANKGASAVKQLADANPENSVLENLTGQQ